MHGQQNIY